MLRGLTQCFRQSKQSTQLFTVPGAGEVETGSKNLAGFDMVSYAPKIPPQVYLRMKNGRGRAWVRAAGLGWLLGVLKFAHPVLQHIHTSCDLSKFLVYFMFLCLELP